MGPRDRVLDRPGCLDQRGDPAAGDVLQVDAIETRREVETTAGMDGTAANGWPPHLLRIRPIVISLSTPS